MRLGFRSLDRKMLRELWHLKGQLLSIGLVVATGIVTVASSRGTYEALFEAREAYYRDYRLADLWTFLERAPESTADRIAQIPGVAAVSTRVQSFATMDLPWLDEPGMGLFLSVPEDRRAVLNDIHIRNGRYIEPGRSDEVVASENFFLANGLQLGDTLTAVLNGRLREFKIVGVAIAPDQSYSVPPGSLYPDDKRYGVFWMSRRVLGPNMDMDDAFNEVAIALSPRANRDLVIREADRLLDPYGGLGTYGREDQLSWKILNDELSQQRYSGTVVPIVFLAVAAFLLNLVLNRLIATQRTEIGALKAFGYTDREVGWHYLSYSVVAVAIGTVLGAVGGMWAGRSMVDLYQEYFKFPTLEYELSPTLVLIGSVVSLVAAVVGGWSSVRHAVALPPAEAMRPAPPTRFHAGFFERMGLGALLPTGGRFVLRNMERRPVRTMLASLGVAFSVSILVIGLFMFDGVVLMMDLQFNVAQREDLTVSFNRPLGDDVVGDLGHLQGVTRVEPFHAVPARLRVGHRQRELALTGLRPDGDLRRIINADGRVHPLPIEGLLLSKWIADELRIRPGESVRVEVLSGSRRVRDVKVAGVVDDFLGVSAYMNLESLHELTRDGPLVSGAYLLADQELRNGLNAELKKAPAVASVFSPSDMYDSFQTQLEDSLFIAIGFMIGFASIISVAVIYNGTRIALSERGRELASLRVLGFTKREVASLLLGEQAVITILAIPIGYWIGYFLSSLVVNGMASETYRIPMVSTMSTYLWAGLTTIVAATLSGWLVRLRMDRMDLISVLKTRE